MLWRSFNSLAPGRCRCNLQLIIFKLISMINILSISCEITLRWMPQNFTYDQSTLAQVMAWCRQATRHYLSQCWPTSRPQWVFFLSIIYLIPRITTPLSCNPGFYAEGGNTTCIRCPMGWKCPNVDGSANEECPPGQFSSAGESHREYIP